MGQKERLQQLLKKNNIRIDVEYLGASSGLKMQGNHSRAFFQDSVIFEALSILGIEDKRVKGWDEAKGGWIYMNE